MRVHQRCIDLAVAAAKAACAAIVMAAATTAAQGQAVYPDRPIKIIVPFSAGGGVDQTARELGHRLDRALGQPIVIDNRPGAGGVLGVRTLINSAPDGYTLLLATAGEVAIAPSLNTKTGYDPIKDLTPIALVIRAPNVLVVNPDVPAHDLAELIAYARAHPNTLSYATSGIGTAQHLAGELFNKMAGVEIQHIPYKGSSQQVLDVVAKRVSMTYASPAAVKPFIDKGQLRALGVTTARRVPTLPDVPAIGEAVPGYALQSWFGLFAPPHTDPAIIARLNGAVTRILRDPALVETLGKTVGEPSYETPAEFSAFLASEVPKFAAIISDAHIILPE
jgi:tripartite-type tricarboxylate transporter receptor subunit TctC